MSEKQKNDFEKESPNKYGLVELATGKYFDKKLQKNLILKNNYVEASGDEFKKNLVAMVFYFYEGGKGRTETAENFVIYGEENLEIVELDQDKQQTFDDAIETEASEVVKDGPVPLFQSGGIVPGNSEPDNVPAILSPEEYQRGERIVEK